MLVDPQQRLAKLNVRELAQFQDRQAVVPASPTPSRWRASVGQQWHDNLRKHAEAAPGEATFEKTLKTTTYHNGWQIELTGKVDQWIEHQGRHTIREIKTISRNLPMEEGELLAHYPSYFAQVQAYMAMALDLGLAQFENLEGELTFVSIAESMVQAVPIHPGDLSLHQAQTTRFQNYLGIRRENHERLTSIRFHPPFADWRPGQKETLDKLRQHSFPHPPNPLLLEAPTGFGKTGVALQYALEQLQSGNFEKLYILTGKSTGQNQILQQLATMQDGGSPRFLQLRNRQEHAIQSTLHTCNGRDCRRNLEEKWQRSGIQPALLYASGPPTLEEVRKLGAQTGVCPYEITRASLPHADILIGDFNYIFSPRNNSLLLEQEGISTARVLLLVDEAHNLPTRVRDCLCAETGHQQARLLADGLSRARASARLQALANCWVDYLQTLEPTPSMPLNEVYQIEDQLSEYLEELLNTHLDWEALPVDAHEALSDLLYLKKLLSAPDTPYLHWSPKPGQYSLDCLDPANEIANTLRQFGSSLLLSATLSPIENFSKDIGLPPETPPPFVQAETPWRKDAYQLAIDTRIDTSFKTRPAHYHSTARTIHQFAANSPKPIVAYFPSYQYAQAILPILQAIDPPLPAILQPQGLPLQQQNQFLTNALQTHKILLLLLGGSFAEGIDQLGGQIHRAIIVGPSLPPTDHIQRARMDRLQTQDQEAAYHQICRQPALTRIRQAIGRMVRAPGQHAAILFHCTRFLQPHYRSLYENLEPRLLRTDAELQTWIQTLRE